MDKHRERPDQREVVTDDVNDDDSAVAIIKPLVRASALRTVRSDVSSAITEGPQGPAR